MSLKVKVFFQLCFYSRVNKQIKGLFTAPYVHKFETKTLKTVSVKSHFPGDQFFKFYSEMISLENFSNHFWNEKVRKYGNAIRKKTLIL